jgi:hypothetical protein
MATLNEVVLQSREIADTAYKIQALLQSKSLIKFFNQSNLSDSLIQSASTLKSYPIVMYGMREHNIRTFGTSHLPAKDTLENKPSNWLSNGDIIVGWYGPCVDKPRVIQTLTPGGYTWRWIDEEDSVNRDPVQLNKFFQSRGFIKMELEETGYHDQLDEIYSIQSDELSSLNYYENYISDRTFLE